MPAVCYFLPARYCDKKFHKNEVNVTSPLEFFMSRQRRGVEVFWYLQELFFIYSYYSMTLYFIIIFFSFSYYGIFMDVTIYVELVLLLEERIQEIFWNWQFRSKWLTFGGENLKYWNSDRVSRNNIVSKEEVLFFQFFEKMKPFREKFAMTKFEEHKISSLFMQ